MTTHTEKHPLVTQLEDKAYKEAEDKLKADLEALGAPIKVVIKNGKIEFMICGCKNYTDFAKYRYEELTFDERKRKVYTPRTGIACARCNALLTEDQLDKQLYGEKKEKGLQNQPETEAKTGL